MKLKEKLKILTESSEENNQNVKFCGWYCSDSEYRKRTRVGVENNLWIFFQKYDFIRKVEPFHLRMKHNIIQMTATAGLTVSHSMNPIFQYIFNCLGKRSISSISKIAVWCGCWYGGIIGPFLFENEQRVAVTVNGKRYRAMLNDFLFLKIEEDDMDDIWSFQFHSDVSWPPRSSELTPLDYFL